MNSNAWGGLYIIFKENHATALNAFFAGFQQPDIPWVRREPWGALVTCWMLKLDQKIWDSWEIVSLWIVYGWIHETHYCYLVSELGTSVVYPAARENPADHFCGSPRGTDQFCGATVGHN